MTVSSDGNIFLVYIDPKSDEARIAIYESSGTAKENFTVGRYSHKSRRLHFEGLLVFGDHIFISVNNFTGYILDGIIESWTIERLKEEKGEDRIIWTNSPRCLNISERHNGNYKCGEVRWMRLKGMSIGRILHSLSVRELLGSQFLIDSLSVMSCLIFMNSICVMMLRSGA